MAVPIDENILIAAAGLVFVPLFIFFIKLLMEIDKMQTKIQTLVIQTAEQKESYEGIHDIKSDINIIKIRVDNIEQKIRELSK